MKNFFIKRKHILNEYRGFFLLAVIMLWMKTYAAQVTAFNLGIDNFMQKLLLFINPLGSSILFLGLTFLIKGRKKYLWLIIIDFIMTFILYANVLYYRFFNDFITLPTLTQTQNFGDVSGSVPSLIKPYDVLYFVDIAVLIILLATRLVKMDANMFHRRRVAAIFMAGLAISAANLGLAEQDRPQLLTRTFDRNYIVKYLGMYNYTIYDAVQSTKASAQRVMADSNDITEVTNYTRSNYASPNPEYFGKAKGRNVIYLHLESMQNFLIDYQLNGEEVTPFLNSLAKDSSTFYFDNFFHQTAQGKTSDAEFMLENSLYGLPQGSAFSTKGLNTYQAAPAILGQQGYTSAVFHGNTGSFWNRDEIYKSFGYDKFFDSRFYDMKPENVANYGLKDKPFFKESIPLLQSLQQPFYTKFIMLSNHYPYPIAPEEATIAPHTTGDKSVDSYFQTARYSDEALEEFFGYLKEAGLYENSIFVMYGDHYGISENHNKAMEQVLGKEITPVENAGLQRVPLLIHVPGVTGGTMHQYGGQIDLLPTLLHLLGIESKNYVQFGSDLLSPGHEQLVPFRDGDFVSPTVTSVNDKYYDTNTGELLKKNEEIVQLKNIVEHQLDLSDKVVNGDLLRFYTPENFVPVDRSKYDYKLAEDKQSKLE
ncbi:LTA synthase family protein [Bacillus sp. T33-2]|uniref:LTA synthase family protein n=1 Tax=Bacillus sp. T33-2 TaxID=2054168 RepID=UPI000C76E04B|nr:LTA synthase family protein [Bacillus sp. T33-2]PLR96797.1 glycerol phosphate lipoteichoic acid synthase [Bacillus sp. T33-2]